MDTKTLMMIIPAVSRIAGGHHVFGVEHLLGEFGHGERAVLLAAARGERSEAGHEEMQAREGDHVDGQLPQVGVELSGEAQGSGHAGHGGADEMIQIAVRRRRQFQRAEANVVKCLDRERGKDKKYVFQNSLIDPASQSGQAIRTSLSMQ